MSEFKFKMSTKADYDNLDIEVSIPSPERDNIILSGDIYSTEERYIAKRDESQNAIHKEYYDRARAVCKYAGTLGAKLKTQHVEQGKLYFIFSFPELKQLIEFQEAIENIVESAVVTAENYLQTSGRVR